MVFRMRGVERRGEVREEREGRESKMVTTLKTDTS